MRPNSAVPQSNLSASPPQASAGHAPEKARPVSAGGKGMRRGAPANTSGTGTMAGATDKSVGERPSSAMVFRPVPAAESRRRPRPSTAQGAMSRSQNAGAREPQFGKPPRLSTLAGAGACFEETILRDNTFGPLLREIKAAYDSYLRSCGAPLDGGRLDSSEAQRGVDAMRRKYTGDDCDLESEMAGGNEAAIRSLEVENAMLRAAHSQLAEKFTELQRYASLHTVHV